MVIQQNVEIPQKGIDKSGNTTYNNGITTREEVTPMGKKKHKKSDEKRLASLLLITAIINLIISLIGLIDLILKLIY